MRIAVNTRLFIKNRLDGMGWFSFETMRRITADHPEHEFIYIFDRPFDEYFITSPNITPVVTGPQARHPFLFWLWFEFSVPAVLKKYKADLFLSPDGYVSLSAKTKTLAVIHDLNFEHYPDDLPWLVRRYYRYFFPKFAERADRIATVSEFSKSDIVNKYSINHDMIDVVYNGANNDFHEISEDAKAETRKKLSRGLQYFVFVGALHPRKNIANLFKAYDLFRMQSESVFPLLIVGSKMWWTKPMQQAYKNLRFRDDVIFCGRLSVEELNNVIGAAYALTYVSSFEGFGIPIVEAFYCGTPVITSDVTSMPEIAGDAALFADPSSPQSICDAMMTLTNDEILRNALIEKANIRKKEFSWEKSADLLWKSIEKTLELK